MLDDLPRVLRRVSCGGLLLSGILTITACDPVPIAVASAASRGSVSAIGSAPRRSDPAALAGPVKPGGRRAVRGEFGMVSSADARATRIGAEVLSKGGNAIDAAVAVGYALSVTHFTAGSLGGGGFMIVRRADGQVFAVDYREKAPAAATVAKNEQQLAAGAHGYLAAPVPGVVAGLNLARRRFGTRPLAELIAPAIALAERGHRSNRHQSLMLAWMWKKLRRDPVIRATYGLGRSGKLPKAGGQWVRQTRLARTLRAIAKSGDAGFYGGEVAAKIAQAMRRGGGLVTEKDVSAYRAEIRTPLRFNYRGYTVHTMPPPSMGGIALRSIMGYLEANEAHRAAPRSAQELHFFIEAARRAYADRRSIGADPAFVDPKVVGPLRKRLLDPAYYRERQPSIDPLRATPSRAVVPIHKMTTVPAESEDTTHFSVVDALGNAVSTTTTLSAAYGARVMVPGTGVMLSNAMGAFSPSGFNVLQPNKRMASSMSPAIVERDGRAVAVIGSPGGDTIPGTVAQLLRNLVDHGMTVDRAVERGRIHHQWWPDKVRMEKKRLPSKVTLKKLKSMGHVLAPTHLSQGHANCIVVDPKTGVAWGVADSRKGGKALGPKALRSGPSKPSALPGSSPSAGP